MHARRILTVTSAVWPVHSPLDITLTLSLGGEEVGGNAAVLAALEPFVFEWVVSRGGSISAEHGVGQHKRDYLSLQRPEAVLGVMQKVKEMLDPRGIMNPFKVLPGSNTNAVDR